MRSVFRHSDAAKRMMRVFAVVAFVIPGVMACDTIDSITGKDVAAGQPIVEGFFGGVVGDDPRSVLAARTILAAGGSAADAAIAYYFMSAVSLPATNSLGGGGLCIDYNQVNNKAELLDFRARAAGGTMQPGARATAIPLAVRGMYALYARSGALAWSDLIAPAERAARFGIPVSRGLARDLSLVGPALLEDPAAARIFARPDGQVMREGDNLLQLDLGAILSTIRTRGAGDLYIGLAANQLLDGIAATGVTIPTANLRGAVPRWLETAQREAPLSLLGATAVIHVPGDGFDAGPIALATWDMYDAVGGLGDAGAPDLRAHLIAEVALRDAVARTLAPQQTPEGGEAAALMASYEPQAATPLAALPAPPSVLQESPAASGFAVVDSFGDAVSCVVTLNNLFGNGRVAPGTGIVLAAEPGPQRGDGLSLLPVVAVNEASREVLFSGSASGGIAAGPIMATVLADVLGDRRDLSEAVAAPRVFQPGDPDIVVVEPEIGDAVIQGLLARGHDVRPVPDLGLVHAISCPDGLRNGSESCSFVTDPRGFGLGVGG